MLSRRLHCNLKILLGWCLREQKGWEGGEVAEMDEEERWKRWMRRRRGGRDGWEGGEVEEMDEKEERWQRWNTIEVLNEGIEEVKVCVWRMHPETHSWKNMHPETQSWKNASWNPFVEECILKPNRGRMHPETQSWKNATRNPFVEECILKPIRTSELIVEKEGTTTVNAQPPTSWR
jgi:hypothetical protein